MKAILKPGKEKPILARHHWIFSGALQRPLTCAPGTLLEVASHAGKKLGWGYFNPQCSLVGRMVSFGEEDPHASIRRRLHEALNLRKSLFDPLQTNGYRLINGEGDALPGLIVDRYDRALVLQSGTAGIDNLKSLIVNELKSLLPECDTLYEKSSAAARHLEGLKEREGLLYGESLEATFLENGISFHVRFPGSQKTGFFLDQREMRKLVGEHAHGKKILNAFSYTGGFSLYGALGGAITTSVDISEAAIAHAKANFLLNGIDPASHDFVVGDVFDYLKQESLDFDLVILDPPAFAKKKEDLPQAMKGYRELNRLVMEKMKQGLLLTCSCSYHLEENLFQKLLFQAALTAKKNVQILSTHRLAPDHPINLYHPESSYLKSFLLAVN